jgi:hypothetical protein
MPRPQFRLRSLFLLTALVAVGCWVGTRAMQFISDVFSSLAGIFLSLWTLVILGPFLGIAIVSLYDCCSHLRQQRQKIGDPARPATKTHLAS